MDTQKTESEALIRLSLAQALVQMWIKAFDALLVHGVNVRKLPEFNNTADLDEANKLPISKGRALLVRWIGRVESGIDAAIRRKNFKVLE